MIVWGTEVVRWAVIDMRAMYTGILIVGGLSCLEQRAPVEQSKHVASGSSGPLSDTRWNDYRWYQKHCMELMLTKRDLFNNLLF